jgi:transcription factor A, mitochondrial
MSRTVEERIGLPPRPKKPLTPYFRYMQKQRPKLVEQNPKISLTDIVKICAKQWETVDEATKKKLDAEYQKEKITYIEERAKYQSKLTDEQRNELQTFKQEAAEAKEKRALRKKIRELGRPKKPATPFLRYLAAEMTKKPRTPGSPTYREHQKTISEVWNKLSEAEKQPYFRSYQKDEELYKKALPVWEEKMIRAGHLDVIRQDVTMLEPPKPKSTPKKPASKPTPA